MPDYDTPSQSQPAPEVDAPAEDKAPENETSTQTTIGNAATNAAVPTVPAGVDTPLLDAATPVTSTNSVVPVTTGQAPVTPVSTDLQSKLEGDSNGQLDALGVTQAITDLYSMNPQQRAQFATELPNLFGSMTPEQRMLVGSIMMQQGRSFEQGFQGGDITKDPQFQAMADIQRAWGEVTAFQGLDPLGRRIDVSVSTTTEDYKTYQGAIDQYRNEQSANGKNVWSDMFMPYSMWTEAGNIARYAGTDNVTYVGEDGLRIYGWDRSTGNYNGINVTQKERDAAGDVTQMGDGVTTLPDGTTVVQTHMGLDKVVPTVSNTARRGFYNGKGEWVEVPDQAAETTPTTPSADQPVQQELFPLSDYEVDQVSEDSPVPGHMPVPQPDAPADAPANLPYLELAMHRAGFDDQMHIDVGSQTIRIGDKTLSVKEFQAVAGLDGLDITGAMTRIDTNPSGVVANSLNGGLNLDPSGVITASGGYTNTQGNTTQGVNGSFAVDVANGTGKGSLNYTRGNGSAGVNATVQLDENGNIVGYGGGLQGTYKFDKLQIGGGIAVQDSQKQEVLDAQTAQGADATVVQNLGGGPVLMVGEEHHLQVDVNGGVQSGAFGANVGVGTDSGTAVTFYQALDPSQLPSDPAAVKALADQVGWPNLQQVYGVDDIDMLSMQPGTAYRFDDFSAAHANAGVSAYGVGVSLGIEGQDYESVMVSKTDDDTVRISVMATDEQGWNAGVNFQGVGLYENANKSGNTTLVELDVDVSTEEGRQALDVFRTTGALPGSYDDKFMQQAMALSAMEKQLATLDPMSPEAAQLRDQYGTLSGQLHGQATDSNASFVGDKDRMQQPDIAPGVTYGHRNDVDFQSHRQTLLGVLQWGSTETLGQDRIFKDGELDVTMTMDRSETGFVDWLLHGEHGVEQAGSVVNPHDDAFAFGVFANKTMDAEDRALLQTLPASEDPMTQAWIDGDIDMDAVGQVGVFLSDDHVERMQDGFDAMRAAGIDPTAATVLAMQNHVGPAITGLDVMHQDGIIDDATMEALGAEGVDINHLAVANPSEFTSMSPAAQQAYLGFYLQATETSGANPWTAMDMISQLPPGEERDQMMNTLAIQIERQDPDHATGAFDMIEMINEMGQVDPTVQRDLQTAVVVSITDRDVMEGLTMTAEEREAAYLHGWTGDGPGVWQNQTQDLLRQAEDGKTANVTIEPWMIQDDVRGITSMVVASDRAGELDTLMGNMEGGPTALLDAMGPMPGNQRLVLRSLIDSPVYGAEALAWAQANGIDTSGW